MKRVESVPMGVVLERRDSNNRWIDHEWLPVAVVPGAPPLDPAGAWRRLADGEGWVQYHAGTLRLDLFRTDTEAYKTGLSNDPPQVYVVLREAESGEHEVVPFAVTASPYEAQDYLDSGEEIVEGVPMPDAVIAWVAAFVEAHHVDEPFRKRRLRRRDDAPDKPTEVRVLDGRNRDEK